jgi:hypothetical protein
MQGPRLHFAALGDLESRHRDTDTPAQETGRTATSGSRILRVEYT